jgi:hypothetical protein
MAGRLAEDDPETAYRHAKAARRVASRVGLVREAAGLAAYHAGEWAEALAELRAARRLSTTDDSYLPVMADCERGLGRPERALDLAKAPEVANLEQSGRVELRIVESGARRDLGQYDAAVVTLQVPELRDRRLRPWSARLFYAYADALVDAERTDEAAEWFARAAAADRDGDTDAAERYAELEGLHILDTEDDEAASTETETPGAPGAPEAQEVQELPEVPEDTAGDGDVQIDEAPSTEVGRPAVGAQEAPGVEETAVDETGDLEPEEPEDVQEEPGAVGPTTIEFKAAPATEAPESSSEDEDGSDEELSAPDVPEAPVLFLEPHEGGPDVGEASGDQEDDRESDGDRDDTSDG